jgi:hypothetical protein
MKIENQVSCYDNGGKSLDRYTVIYNEHPLTRKIITHRKAMQGYNAVSMDHRPSYPFSGICQHCVAVKGRHLGKRILFENLPLDCQTVVKNDLKAYSGL